MSQGLKFQKMHGAGNDFVILDARVQDTTLSLSQIRLIGDRHRGVGFDQLATIYSDTQADLRVRFWNADGSVSAACGNATRCIAYAEMIKNQDHALTIRTDNGLLPCQMVDGIAAVNMGPPKTDWKDIPLRSEADTLHMPLADDPVGTNMGNPHCSFFVEDVQSIALEKLGPLIENDPLFPERTNVQFVQVLGPNLLRMRVWERGTGITLASGSSSCAVTVAAIRRGLINRSPTEVLLDGGTLCIDWRDDGVWMSGPTAHVFDGIFTSDFLGSADD